MLTFIPADGQFAAAIVPRFAALITGKDLVVGYFTDVRQSLAARLLSTSERALYRALFGRLPVFKGIMMFRRTLLAELHIEPSGRGWGALMEILVKSVRAGKRIANEPTTLRPRTSGRSKVNNWRSVRANLAQAVKLRRSLTR
jgi:hypothetical protein